MKKVFSYDVYIGERNKVYLVEKLSYSELLKGALKRFKKSRDQIIIKHAFVVGDDLYLSDPKDSRAVLVWVAYIKPNIRRATYGN